MIETLQDNDEINHCSVQLDDNQHIHLNIVFNNGKSEHIYFPLGFPINPPLISSVDFKELSPWQYDGNILSSFINYYNLNHYDGRKKTFS